MFRSMRLNPSSLAAIAAGEPSPLPSAVLRLLVALVVVMLLWSCLGHVDIIAEAPGRLVPSSFIKLVQPSEAGVVSAVLVTEGQSVRKGDVLAKLDATSVNADLAAAQKEEQLDSLELRRVHAELTGQPFDRLPGDSVELFEQVRAQYDAKRLSHEANLAEAREGLARAQAELAAAIHTQSKFEHVLPSYRDDEKAYQDLAELQLQPKMSAQEHVRARIEHEDDLRSQVATVSSLRAAVAQQSFKLQQLQADYIKDLRQEEADLSPKLERAHEERIKQAYRAGQLELTAPADGVIKDIAIHAAGTVVSPGAVLMTLIPLHDSLRAEAWVRNEDSAFVFPGQHVQVKVAAYPFQKYGMLHGTVLSISPDSSEANSSSSLPSPALATAPLPNSSEPPQYKVLVALDAQQLTRDGRVFPVKAGMQLTAEINQGRRTVMEYLLSPVRKVVFEAARER